MTPSDLSPGDIIMVDIDGNSCACQVITIEPNAIRLCDLASSRYFWRTTSSLMSCTRFSNTIVSHINYPDHLKSNNPDVVIKFGKPRVRRVPSAPKPEKKFTARELRLLRELLGDAAFANEFPELSTLPNQLSEDS